MIYVGTLQHEHGVGIISFRLFARLSCPRSRNTNFVYDGMTKTTTITLRSTPSPYLNGIVLHRVQVRKKDIWPGVACWLGYSVQYSHDMIYEDVRLWSLMLGRILENPVRYVCGI